MKTVVRRAVMALAVAAVCQTGIALAEDLVWVSDDSKTATAEKAPASEQSSYTDGAKCADQCSSECDDCLCEAMRPCRTWYVDGRIQSMFSSQTSYQFGTPPLAGGPQFAPLSKLDFGLDSIWGGVRVGVQKPNLDIHFEWLTPMAQSINGSLTDYDWSVAGGAPASISQSATRFNDGQKLELEGDYKWSDCFLGTQMELWPLAGFRFQRFDMTAYNGLQLVNDGTIPGIPAVGTPIPVAGGNSLSLNQQYYIGYAGAQLRRYIERECRPPIMFALQFDVGATWGYTTDDHILRGRIITLNTSGQTVHLALIADAPFNCHTSVGLQVDHSDTCTWGSIRESDNPALGSWTNGVQANSAQSSITGYLRYLW